MTDTRLIFNHPPITGAPVRLVFGETDAPAIAAVTVAAAGHLSGLRMTVGVRLVVRVASSARITGLHWRVAGRFDINVLRLTQGGAHARWQDATPVHASTGAQYQQAQRIQSSAQTRWQNASTLRGAWTLHWQQCQALMVAVAARYQQASVVMASPAAQHYQQAKSLHAVGLQRYQQALVLPTTAVASHFQAGLQVQTASTQHYQNASPIGAVVLACMGVGMPIVVSTRGRYQQAWPPRAGKWSGVVVPPTKQPCYAPMLPARLVFEDEANVSLPAHLIFGCKGHRPNPLPGLVVVPAKRVYIVVNEINLFRCDTGAQLHAHGFNMQLDYKSWTWSWSAVLHADAAPHLGRESSGAPAELAVFINGTEFRLRLEDKSRDRRFNPTRWAVSGRGKAATLDASWSPSMSFSNATPRTAQQLMLDVLTVNGVSNGWSVDWNLQDWPVPANAWAMQGAYIDAINDIATSVGGYVQPHPTDAVLRILPRYPSAPWAWAGIAPDYDIPADIAEVENTRFIDKPDYNKVFIGGVNAGVFGPFKRAGTAGDILAPQVTHALITHADAHRQRGLAELSDTGQQELVTITMPVLSATGVIAPGKFVRYNSEEGSVIGIVRSTSIAWNRPVLRQTIEVETHV